MLHIVWPIRLPIKRNERGQSYTEYIILIGALIVVAVAIYYFRDAIADAFRRAGDWVKSAW